MALMTRRDFMEQTAAGAAGFMLARTATATGDAAPRRPNFVLIVTDDHRWDAVGCAGNTIIQTPNMDKMAAEGIYFPNAFVTTPICCTSRTSILTGMYARSHGIVDFATDLAPDQFAAAYPAQLARAGYRNGFFGKYGVGAHPPREALGLVDLPPGKDPYFREVDGERRHVTHITADQAVDFIQSCTPDQPFCLSVSFNAPHADDYALRPYPPEPECEALYKDAYITPPKLADPKYYEALPDFLKNSEGRKRWGTRFCSPKFYQESMRDNYRMITGVDNAVGRIRAALEAAGLADNTVIVVMGDNGVFYGERGLADKWYAYEESIRVPLIMFDPALPKERRGARVEEMALNIDLAPTLLEYAGVAAPPTMQGQSLCSLARGVQTIPWRSDWYFDHLFKHPLIPRSEGIRDREWTYIRWIDTDPLQEELYDLRSDPHEEHNLAGEAAHAGTLNRLRARREEYRRLLPEFQRDVANKIVGS